MASGKCDIGNSYHVLQSTTKIILNVDIYQYIPDNYINMHRLSGWVILHAYRISCGYNKSINMVMSRGQHM